MLLLCLEAVVFGVTNPVMLQLLAGTLVEYLVMKRKHSTDFVAYRPQADFPISVLLQPRHREDASTQPQSQTSFSPTL